MNYPNAENFSLIQNYENLEKLKLDLREIEEEERKAAGVLAEICKRKRELQDIIYKTENVAQIIDDIAVSVWRHESNGHKILHVKTCAKELGRGAEVYTSAHDNNRAGVNLSSYNKDAKMKSWNDLKHTYDYSFDQDKKRFIGANRTWEEAEKAAFDWVVRGLAPEYKCGGH